MTPIQLNSFLKARVAGQKTPHPGLSESEARDLAAERMLDRQMTAWDFEVLKFAEEEQRRRWYLRQYRWAERLRCGAFFVQERAEA